MSALQSCRLLLQRSPPAQQQAAQAEELMGKWLSKHCSIAEDNLLQRASTDGCMRSATNYCQQPRGRRSIVLGQSACREHLHELAVAVARLMSCQLSSTHHADSVLHCRGLHMQCPILPASVPGACSKCQPGAGLSACPAIAACHSRYLPAAKARGLPARLPHMCTRCWAAAACCSPPC